MARQLIRGDIHLCSFPQPNKTRPVLILTRNSSLQLLSSVTVAPISSTIRGGPAEVILGVEDGMKDACSVNAHNTMTVVKERIGRRVSSLRADQMKKVCAALGYAFGCLDVN